jgi:hypothetical protein
LRLKTASARAHYFLFSVSRQFYTHQLRLRHLERQVMNRKGVLEPSGPRTDSQETTPLLNAYSHTENTGGSAVDGTALHRNEQDGKNIVHENSLHVSE